MVTIAKCVDHNRDLELICCECLVLVCSFCVPHHQGHPFVEASDQIDYFQNQLDKTNAQISSKMDYSDTLAATIDGVSNLSKDLKDFIVELEEESKSPALKQKEKVDQQISLEFKKRDRLISLIQRYQPTIVDTHTTANPNIKTIQQPNQTIQLDEPLYKLVDNTSQIENIKKDIKSSFKLEFIPSKRQKQQLQQQLNQIHYILSMDRAGSPTIITLPNSIDIKAKNEEIFTMQSLDVKAPRWSYTSIIAVGDYIYNFGGIGMFAKSNRYQRFNLVSMTIDIDEEMTGLSPVSFLSTCYDGNSYIYILDSYMNTEETNIIRYNIHSLQFERFTTTMCKGDVDLSFFYSGDLFSFGSTSGSLLRFNVETKKTTVVPVESSKIITYSNSSACCHDGKGGIYALKEKKFFYINVDTCEIKKLDYTFLKTNARLQYHRVSETEAYIYCLQGAAKSFVYSVANNQWKQILSGDTKDRLICASIIYNR
ncbi:hypothetical protein PPL_07374 [Heterostelium album PN500]|uniref:B box-type domain-containing protein n=1 Tax=Heterostelium pallidum (strain ATCC 26659 / Pp 5 / PN500) TaxID=670386 RepID=D3BFS3_HETP5|nr:hypothetical protein PPL_07374 [Heterostelium album PN500]EFA79683.1 hypothetical protein PPL_07374 [Heterostelium album PN500]|eukprot:XP_020431804.1 hypothetical protein PPL_07374 [Heterostelium album PN500]